MYVIYTPADAPMQKWTFDPARVRSQRAIQIERHAGQTWEEWLQGVQMGRMRARRVLLWHLISQDHPTLRFEDTPDFLAGELAVHHSPAELAEMIREARRASAQIPEDQYAMVMATLEREAKASARIEREHFRAESEPEAESEAEAEAEGKAPGRRSASAGASTAGR